MFSKETRDRDIRFVFNTVILGLLLLALLQAFSPYIGKPDPQMPQILSLMHKEVHLRAEEVPPLLRRADGKPVMMIVYASWCPYCKRLMPDVADLIQHDRLGGFVPLMVSVDDRADFLAIYLVHNSYEKLFTPYIMDSDLPDVMKETGSRFEGHIPYIGFFNPQGKVMMEYLGMADKATLLATINKLSHK